MNILLSSNKSFLFIVTLIIIFFSFNTYAKNTKHFHFSEVAITTPFQLTHPVMPINLLTNKGKELVTFSIDENGNRWLTVYALDNKSNYSKNIQLPLPKDFYSFDISTFKKGHLQTLYFLSSSMLYALNETQVTQPLSFKPLHVISSIALGTKAQHLAKGYFLTQLNDDDFDDIYIADFDKTHVLIQTDDGFKTSSLPIKPETIFTPNVMQYLKTKIYFGDINFDNLQDIMYVDNGKLIYFLQQSDFTISPVAHNLSINKLISGIDWWNKVSADGENLDQSNLHYRKIEKLKDINNDNIIDMVVRFTQSEGVLDKTNDYEIYLGKNTNNTLQFSEKPNSAIKAEGTLTDIQFVDINNDNKDEILVAGFDIGLSQIIGALLSGNIDQDVHLFYMDEQSHFNKKSKITKEVALEFSLRSGTSGNPVVTLLDVNGDQLQDLMLSKGDDTLRIYLGTNEKRLFTKKYEKYKIQLPKQGDMLVSDDLNNDGKDDILIKYGREDDKILRNTFKILMSK